MRDTEESRPRGFDDMSTKELQALWDSPRVQSARDAAHAAIAAINRSSVPDGDTGLGTAEYGIRSVRFPDARLSPANQRLVRNVRRLGDALHRASSQAADDQAS